MNNKGLLGCVFDISFSEFVTPRLIKILFIIAIVGSAMGALTILRGGLVANDAVIFLASLIMAPVVFLVCVLWSRVCLELIMVVFRIAENTDRLVEQGRSGAGKPREPAAPNARGCAT
jgi:hypothetical protein